MESHEDKGQDRKEQHDPASENERNAPAQDRETAAPSIARAPLYPPDWIEHPDRTMTVETSRIHRPSETINPNLVIVPFVTEAAERGEGRDGGQESDDQDEQNGPGQRRGAKKSLGGTQEGGRKSEGPEQSQPKREVPNHHDEEVNAQDQPRNKQHGQRASSSEPRPLWQLLLYSTGIALLCSAVVAGAIVYFFGGAIDRSSGKEKTLSKGSSKGGSSKGGSSEAGSGSSGEPGSSDDSNSTKNTEPGTSASQKTVDAAQLVEAETAWLIAVRELHDAQKAESAAKQSEGDARAILEFLKSTLLSAGRPGGVSLVEAFWAAGKGKDLSLRKAVDTAEVRVPEAFAERPLAEASVREMLGLAYLNLGEPALAVKQYERAYGLRQGHEGARNPDTAVCRNQLAVAYRLAGHADKASRLFDDNPGSSAQASSLALNGSMLLEQKKATEAELKLRQALAMRQKSTPDDWSTFDTESALGEALTKQQKYAEAEPLLLSGYEGLRLREASVPPSDKARVKKALERLVKLYEAWGKNDEATRWRKLLGTTG
jgi:tetratricopeptide (TPR) repeat protein